MTGSSEKEKPRLLILLNRLVIGGPAIDIISMAGFLQNDFTILIVYGEKETHEIEANYLLQKHPNLHVQKITSLKRSLNPIFDILSFFSILKIIFSFKPSIVHTHGAKSGFIGRVVAFLCRVPVIVHTFHGHVFHSYYSKFKSNFIIQLERILASISTHIITLSKHQKIELVELYKVAPASKFTIIPLGIDQTYFLSDADRKRKEFRTLFSLKESDIAIGMVSRIVPIKNHLMFLKVAIEILRMDKSENIYFFIIGDGDVMPQLKSFLHNQNVVFATPNNPAANARIIFTSWLTDIAMVHHGLDIVALTSHNEGTPLSLIEAQFCGKPVVATNVGGIKDVVLDGETGFLIPDNDVKAFTEKIALLINDTSIKEKFSTKGHIFAQNNFSLQSQVEKTKEFYKTALRN